MNKEKEVRGELFENTSGVLQILYDDMMNPHQIEVDGRTRMPQAVKLPKLFKRVVAEKVVVDVTAEDRRRAVIEDIVKNKTFPLFLGDELVENDIPKVKAPPEKGDNKPEISTVNTFPKSNTKRVPKEPKAPAARKAVTKGKKNSKGSKGKK